MVSSVESLRTPRAGTAARSLPVVLTERQRKAGAARDRGVAESGRSAS
jgi:hypothetical protein